MAAKPELLPVSVKNIRDLSYLVNRDNKRIKKGRLLRSGALFNISEEDMRILYEDYDLRKIIDLRNSIEIEEKPDTLYKDIEYVKCSLQEESDILVVQDEKTKRKKEAYFKKLDRQCQNEEFARNHMCEFYRNILNNESCIKGFERFFEQLMNTEGAALWRCSLGRDRCGMASALLLMALDVKKEDIMEDYLNTNLSLKEDATFYEKAHREYLESFFEGIEEKFGNIEVFFKEIKVNKEKLKEKYLED